MKKNLLKSKTILLTLIFAFTVISANAQSLFFHNACNIFPAYGDSLTGITVGYDTTGVLPGAGGTGVSWNFSSLTTNTTSPMSTELFLNPASTTYGSNFPSANLSSTSAGNALKYYKFSPDSVTQLGAYTSATNCNYPVWDPFKYTICPFNYGNTYTDHYNHSNCGNNSYSHSYATTTFLFDGTGSLSLPTATYSNVTRYKYDAAGLDSSFNMSGVFTSAYTYSISAYYWLDESSPMTPMVFVWQTISIPMFAYYGKGVSSVSYTHYPATLVAGIATIQNHPNALLYPVPATDVLHIALPADFTAQSFKVFDYMGRVIMESIVAENIDVSSLQKGIYFVDVKSTNGSIFKQKFTKE